MLFVTNCECLGIQLQLSEYFTYPNTLRSPTCSDNLLPTVIIKFISMGSYFPEVRAFGILNMSTEVTRIYNLQKALTTPSTGDPLPNLDLVPKRDSSTIPYKCLQNRYKSVAIHLKYVLLVLLLRLPKYLGL